MCPSWGMVRQKFPRADRVNSITVFKELIDADINSFIETNAGKK